MASLSAFYAPSPVQQAELNFQQRSRAAQRPRHWWRRILTLPYRLLVVVAAVGSAALISAEIAAAALSYDFASLPPDVHTVVGVFLFFVPVAAFIPMALLINFKTQFRTLAFAANSISREKRGGTWDLLLLTPLSARQIVRGKWWATLRNVYRDYLLLALLRAGALVWALLEGNRIIVSGYPAFHIEIHPHYFPTSALHLSLGVLAIFLYTLLNAGYTVAFGTLGSVFNRGGGTSLTLAIIIRTAILLVLGGAIALIGHWYFFRLAYSNASTFSYGDGPPWQVYQFLVTGGVTLIENGAVVSSMIMTFNPSYYAPYSGSYYTTFYAILAGGIMSGIICVLLTLLALRLAQWAIRRQGALVPHRDWWEKAKKKKLVEDVAAVG